jgi:hypothetical protein
MDMIIKNLLVAGLVLISLVSLGCASTKYSDDLRAKLSGKDLRYCCTFGESRSPAEMRHTP